LLAIDGLDGPLPAGEGFLEVDVDVVSDIIAVTLEERVILL